MHLVSSCVLSEDWLEVVLSVLSIQASADGLEVIDKYQERHPTRPHKYRA